MKKVDKKSENLLINHWQNMVDGQFFYRGMSRKDLHEDNEVILDPSQNPLTDIVPLLLEYSDFLLKLIEQGLKFDVKDFYVEPLEKILNWTIRDIKNPGIDFTTNYADAVAYAFNYAGSQVKHNFNIISNSIHECEKEQCMTKESLQKLREITARVQEIFKRDVDSKHNPVVVKVKRSCEAFEDQDCEQLNVGGFDFFIQRVAKIMEEKKVKKLEEVAFLFHQKSQIENFNIRLKRSLVQTDIVELIKF